MFRSQGEVLRLGGGFGPALSKQKIGKFLGRAIESCCEVVQRTSSQSASVLKASVFLRPGRGESHATAERSAAAEAGGTGQSADSVSANHHRVEAGLLAWFSKADPGGKRCVSSHWCRRRHRKTRTCSGGGGQGRAAWTSLGAYRTSSDSASCKSERPVFDITDSGWNWKPTKFSPRIAITRPRSSISIAISEGAEESTGENEL